MTASGTTPRRGVLEHALAAVGELELGRAGGGELDQLVVEERRARLQPVGHRHVVDALDRVVDEHHLGVQAQRAVDRRRGARALEPLARERQRDVVVGRVGQQRADARVVAVEEARRVGVESPSSVGRRAAAGTSRSRRAPRRRPGRTGRPCARAARPPRAARTRRSRARPSARSWPRSPAAARRPAGARSIRSWWWSVPNSRATRSENSNSSPERSPTSSKPIENVASPVWPSRASSATIRRGVQPAARAGCRPARRRPSAAGRRAGAPRASRPASRRRRAGARTAGPSRRARGGGRRARSTSSVAGGSLRHAAQDRARRGHDRVPRQVVVQRDRVHARVDAAARQQRRQRRGGAQRAVRPRPGRAA